MYLFYHLCQHALENQSNAKFSRYRLYYKKGCIEDEKSAPFFKGRGDVTRTFEFSNDLKHFFLFTFDRKLKVLTVEYYDRDLNKIWKREFEETTDVAYDYTTRNIYLVANNDLYIIECETGNDMITPKMVGSKADIRKMEDGILMLQRTRSDAIMKTDLEGNIIWKTNAPHKIIWFDGVQFVEEKLVLPVSVDASDDYQSSGEHIYVIDVVAGDILLDAESMSSTYFDLHPSNALDYGGYNYSSEYEDDDTDYYFDENGLYWYYDPEVGSYVPLGE